MFSTVGMVKYSFSTRRYIKQGLKSRSYQIFLMTFVSKSGTVSLSAMTTELSHNSLKMDDASICDCLSLKRALISTLPERPSYDKLLEPVMTVPGSSPFSLTSSLQLKTQSLAWQGSSVFRISREPSFILLQNSVKLSSFVWLSKKSVSLNSLTKLPKYSSLI